MKHRGIFARASLFGLGIGVLGGAVAFTFSETADAASCGRTAVQALGITRSAASAVKAGVRAPSEPLAFTGVTGLGTAMVVGAFLLAGGALLVALARRRSLRRSHFLAIAAGVCATAVAFLGAHGAGAAVPAASSTSCSPAATTASGTTTTPGTPTGPVTATTPVVGTTVAGSSGGTTDPGSGTSPAGPTAPIDPGTESAAPALPDASQPVALVLGAAVLGAGALVLRRRRTASGPAD